MQPNNRTAGTVVGSGAVGANAAIGPLSKMHQVNGETSSGGGGGGGSNRKRTADSADGPPQKRLATANPVPDGMVINVGGTGRRSQTGMIINVGGRGEREVDGPQNIQ